MKKIPPWPIWNRSRWDTKGIDHRARRIMLLRAATGQPRPSQHWIDTKQPTTNASHLSINCEGGVGMKDPDLQWLLKRKYISIVRVPYSRGWGGKYLLRRTYAKITELGWDALWNERF